MSARDDFPEPPRRYSRAGSEFALYQTIEGWREQRARMCDELDRLCAIESAAIEWAKIWTEAGDRPFNGVTARLFDLVRPTFRVSPVGPAQSAGETETRGEGEQ